jgi:LmbE family N-acetylglucosaminyl deacetylase
VAVSPHLDDAVFSAGGIIAVLADSGWAVKLVTCFTASVAHPTGFALSTQLDKGLDANVDYMALRRDEDAEAAAILGAHPIHLAFTEAPHRGYSSASQLFDGVHRHDTAPTALLRALARNLPSADLVLAPQALGSHVDHIVVAAAVAELAPAALWWRDVPYALRQPALTNRAATEVAVDITTALDRKIAAAQCYRSQLDFQFGGAQQAAAALRQWAAAEAARTTQGSAAEVLTATTRCSWPA